MEQYLDASDRLKITAPRKIAIVRALPGLGDLLCCVPALRALRTAVPQAQITLIGLPVAKQFVERFSQYVDDYLEFPGFPGIPEVPLQAGKTVAFLAEVQRLNFDLALQMHGSGLTSNSFVLLLGAAQTAGCFPREQACPDDEFFMPYPQKDSEVWRNLKLMEFLGIPLQGDALEFPVWEADWRELEAIATTHHLSFQNCVCIHPGASTGARRWSVQNFAAIADAIAAEGFQIVLTGTVAEVELTEAVAQAMHTPAVNLAGQTNLGTMAALLKKSRLLICNDTGVSHLAAALRVNSVVVFSNSDPQRWAPLNRQRHRIVRVSEMEPVNLEGAIAAVLTEATDLLNQELVYAS